MKDILDKFPEILQYGCTGLSALVFLFTFLLLKQQSAKDRPNKSMLQSIKVFMGITIILAIISLIDASLRSSKNRGEQPQNKVSIIGTIKNNTTGSPVDNAEIFLLRATGNDLVTILTTPHS
jgi:hypothetical protein